jgi:CheY-like chemotaxis protein
MARVLLVDDEALIRRLAARMLEDAGYDVTQAEDGIAALDLIHELNGAVDLLITDIVMPRMSGAELVERVEAEYPSLKILCISGYADQVLPKGQHFLAKPFTGAVLVATIQKLFGIYGNTAVSDESQRSADVQARLAAAKAKLREANQEYRRLTEVCADTVDTPSDGRLALTQAMKLKQTALSEYSKVLREWTTSTSKPSTRSRPD